MRNLLYKEYKLAIHPSMFLFLLFGALLLIPSWPYFIAFGYLIIGFMNTFFLGRSNNDIFFTACLPVRKSDIVLARVLSIASFELLQVIAAIPFAILNLRINPAGNAAGMNPNFAFFGFVLMMYAVLNLIFFPWFYKTAYKAGIPILFGTLAAVIFAGVVELAVHVVPVLSVHLNAIGSGYLGSQLICLAAGIVLFVGLTWLAYKKAAKRFDKVDL